MTDIKHTPGPWTTSQQNGLRLFIVGQDEALAECFRMEQTGGFDATLFANARLIAAAPELLEALKELVGKLEDVIDIGKPEMLGKAWAAIRKAEEL